MDGQQYFLQQSQEEMWQEFNSHFANPNRDRGVNLNHHDFLDSNYIKEKDSARRSFFRQMGGNSMQGIHSADRGDYMSNTRVDLGYNRYINKYQNFNKMVEQSYEINMTKQLGVPKYLQEKLRAQGKKQISSKVYQTKGKSILENMKKNQLPKLPSKSTIKKPKKQVEHIVEKDFDFRNIFVLLDGQNILAENLEFTYIEINERLSQFVPDKVWQSQAAKRLNLNEKIELNKPSQQMREQIMLQILEEASSRMNKLFESAWLLDGRRMLSPLDLPIDTRIIVASENEEFIGISGLEHFDQSLYTTTIKENRNTKGGITFVKREEILPTIDVKPQPQTWV